MYTVIFNRERYGDNYNGRMDVLSFETEREVREYVSFMTFEQERLQSDQVRMRNERYFYGDYGFLVLKNGIKIYECGTFDQTTDECNILPYDDDDTLCIDLYDDKMNGSRHFFELSTQYTKLVSEEKEYQESLTVYKQEKKKTQEVEKEKALLKQLLEKYPDMKE